MILLRNLFLTLFTLQNLFHGFKIEWWYVQKLCKLTSSRMGNLCNPYHSVILMIATTLQAAEKEEVWSTSCKEIRGGLVDKLQNFSARHGGIAGHSP